MLSLFRRLQQRINTKIRITLGLCGIIISVLLIAGLSGLIPNEHKLIMQGRILLAESIAINSSAFLTQSDIWRMENNLLLQIQRHTDLLSAGIRRIDGKLISDLGQHAHHWTPLETDTSTDDRISVPIWEGEKQWGSVELRFQALAPEGLIGYAYDKLLLLLSISFACCFVIFYLYLGKMLKHLDPSQAIPDRVRSAFDTMAEGLLVLDARSNIVLANQAFAGIVERPAADLLGMPVSRFAWSLSSDSANALYPWDKALQQSQSTINQLVRLPHADGTWRTFMTNCSPVIASQGKAAGVLVSFDDVTLLEEKEIELRKSKEEAEAANRAKSDFLANMSHEIRTPMNAILGFTEVLKRGYSKDLESNQKHLNTIASNGEHLLGLINDILDLSKVEAGQLEVETIDCRLHHIIHEVIQIMRVRAEEKGLSLQFTPLTPLPEIIQSDPARLRQILTNLIGNAIKFTRQGGIEVSTRLHQKSNDYTITLSVADTGIGMSQQQCDQIFQPFVQADSSITRRFGGTGLGLTISKRFAEALGGDIYVKSAEGKGSKFIVDLPIAPVSSEALIPIPQLQEAETPTTETHQRWQFEACDILVVDDGAENRNLLEILLTDAGLKVATADNGQTACQMAEQTPYDLILMDVEMPIMDGYSAVAHMRKKGQTQPIIALTAHAMKGAEEKCLAAGFSGYMTKPINIDHLFNQLAKLIKGRPVDDVPQQTQVKQSNTSALVSTLSGNTKLHSIIDRFIDKLIQKLEHMQKQLLQDNYQALADAAHWLKGSGGSVGFGVFTTPADKLEQAAKSQQSQQCHEQLKVIIELSERVKMGRVQPTHQPAAESPGMSDALDQTDNDSSSVKSILEHPAAQKFHPLPDRVQSRLATRGEKFIQIINRFKQRLDEQLPTISQALENGQYEQIYQFAHWLKGSGGSVGFDCFTEPAYDLEQAAQQFDLNSCRAIVALVEALNQRITLADISTTLH
ncbi:ATP-binding protein [Maricurvus nonylphenolicus]|uniref:hybrid sensor histidine kinase/response regulator n=1 Tax=Maricurvus nonylphenolicus TaxID=1008307 RepID=UPI0036F21239